MKRSLFLTLGSAGVVMWGITRLLRTGFSFAGKSVLITGGSRGLGLIIARRLAAEGARLALLARDEEELERAGRELHEFGGEAIPIRCDLMDRTQLLGAIEEVMERYGAIDVLINNAGIIEVGPLENMQRKDFEREMNLHFWAPYNLMRQVIPHMRRRGEGRIVNVSSFGGKVGVPHLAPYCASKFALVGLSDSVRSELARDGIHVTTVTPSVMRTGSHVNAKFKGDHAAEFTWFALSATMPLLAVKAERAARMIVEACRRGQSSLIIGWSARLGIAANAIAPSVTGELLKLANQLLPAGAGSEGDELKSGWEAQEDPRIPGWLSRLGSGAISQNNEG